MKLPIYDVVIDLNDEETGMSCISLVDEPAVEKDFLLFAKEAPKKALQFAIDDNMEHCITGVAIRADYPIYRVGNSGYEYYVRFSKETIKDIVEKYSKQGLWNVTSLQHDGKEIDGAIMVEMYIKDSEKGISPKGFEDIEEGSLFTTYKIVDEKLWEDIKNSDNINGFSIEIVSDLEPTEEYVEMITEEDWLMELLAWLEDEEDVEVIMKDDKKKDKFKRTTSGDIKAVMDANRKVNITIGKRTLWEQQIFQLGENINGKLFAVVYDPQSSDWSRIDIHSIDKLELTELEIENWDFNAKWKQIVADESIGIIDTAVGHTIGNTFRDAIETNRLVMLTYHDETEDPATGYRTVLVTSLGYTTGSDGSPRNQTIRGYTYSGSSKTGLEENDGWRFYLCRRIKDFKIVDYVDPILQAPPHYNGEAKANSGKLGSMSDVELVMKFPPIRKV